MAGVILVFVSISAVVVASHYVQLYVLGGMESASSLLFRRLVFGNLLVAYLLRQSFLKHHLRRRLESEQNAKIQALQSRIRPHFLFNSMNVIASLIPVDPDAAEQAVEDLSELFRASLQQAGTYVRTSQELDLC
jgi:two-component system sensor histidine kinase AlgZ